MSAQDGQDKAAPKLLTMAMKYLYNSTFQLKRGLDPDAPNEFVSWCEKNIKGGFDAVVSYAKVKNIPLPSKWSLDWQYRFIEKVVSGQHKFIEMEVKS